MEERSISILQHSKTMTPVTAVSSLIYIQWGMCITWKGDWSHKFADTQTVVNKIYEDEDEGNLMFITEW